MNYKRFSGFFRIVMCLSLFSCNHTHSRSEIIVAMDQYDHFIRNMDADSIAMLFTPDGNLGNMAHGQDSIRKFLASFKNIKVLSSSSTPGTIELSGDSSIQKGTYRQVDLVNNKDTIFVKGTYITNWKWVDEKGWRIKSIITIPIP